MNNKIKILGIVFLIIFSVSVFGYEILDEENFNNYFNSEPEIIYYSGTDEIVSDGDFDNYQRIFGYGDSFIDGVFFIANPNSGTFNSIIFDVYGVQNSPENNDFIEDVYICEFTGISLVTFDDLNDCDSTPKLILHNFPISDFWGGTTGTKRLPVEEFTLNSAKKYVIYVETVGGTIESNQAWRISLDTNPTSSYMETANNNEMYIANITLASEDIDISDLYTQSNGFWECSSNGNLPKCRDTVGTGAGSTGWSIKGTSNKYMNIYATGWDMSGYELTTFKLNPDGIPLLSTSVDTAITLQYDIRLNNYESDNFGGDINNLGAGFWTTDNYISGATQRFFTSNMGSVQNFISQEQYQRIRGISGSANFIGTYPQNSSCDVNDGDWHQVNNIFYHNTSQLLFKHEIYIDGVLCYQNNLSVDSVSYSKMFQDLHLDVLGVFNIDIDNIKFYTGAKSNEDVTASEEGTELLNCPVDNCIFYDDFTTYDNGDTVDSGGWTYFPESSIVFDNRLFLDNSYDFPIIQHTFLDNNYDLIYGVVDFETNNTETPVNLQDLNNFVSYGITTYCYSDNIVFTYNVYIFQDLDFTQDNNRTIYNVYTVLDGKLRQLATLTPENGDNIIIKNSFDMQNQKVSMNYITYSDIERNFIPDVSFSQDFFSPCSKLSYTEIERRDDSEMNYFFGINKIFYYGEDFISNDEDNDIFVNVEPVSINDSLVKVNIEELLHNGAASLGFRTTAGKFIFFCLVMFLFVFALYQSDVSDSAKKLVSPFFIILFITGGWYFKFVPTIVFMFLILIIAIIGAVVYQKTFTASNN